MRALSYAQARNAYDALPAHDHAGEWLFPGALRSLQCGFVWISLVNFALGSTGEMNVSNRRIQVEGHCNLAGG